MEIYLTDFDAIELFVAKTLARACLQSQLTNFKILLHEPL